MKNKLSILAALSALFCLIAASGQVIDCCRGGLRVCAELILPSLFPFFVLSGLLSRLGFPALLGRLIAPAAARLFRVSGPGASALAVSLCGGYPMGASYIADLVRSGQIGLREAERLLAFCNNSGPAFAVGALGVGVFSSARAGLLLYASHALAALLTGFLLRGRGEKTSPELHLLEAAPPMPLSRALPEAVRQAVLSVLSVCGFVVCFTVLTGLLEAGGLFSSAAGWLAALTGAELHAVRALLSGLLELGSAAASMQGLALTPGNLALAAGVLGWGGLSVQFQTLSVLDGTDIKSTLHLAGRFLSACLGALLAWGLGRLFF